MNTKQTTRLINKDTPHLLHNAPNIIVNTDGGCRYNGSSGLGGVIRTLSGKQTQKLKTLLAQNPEPNHEATTDPKRSMAMHHQSTRTQRKVAEQLDLDINDAIILAYFSIHIPHDLDSLTAEAMATEKAIRLVQKFIN